MRLWPIGVQQKQTKQAIDHSQGEVSKSDGSDGSTIDIQDKVSKVFQVRYSQ